MLLVACKKIVEFPQRFFKSLWSESRSTDGSIRSWCCHSFGLIRHLLGKSFPEGIDQNSTDLCEVTPVSKRICCVDIFQVTFRSEIVSEDGSVTQALNIVQEMDFADDVAGIVVMYAVQTRPILP